MHAWRRYLSSFVRSVWFFPLVLFIGICGLALFEIHGSSVGRYNTFFYGEQYQDPDLLKGEPRGIRSDEWLVVTPLSVAQQQHSFTSVNPNIGEGHDVSVVIDAPHDSWWALFQPQNWSFLILPLEKAFAFKWWFMGFLLIVSCYAFILSVLPRRRLFATVIALALFFAPYIHWWYQSITILPLAYGFLILAALLQLLRTKSPKARWGWSFALGYLITAFIFVQYPPFLLPVAGGIAAFAVGYVLENWKKQKQILKPGLLHTAGTVVGAVSVFILFLWQKAEVLRTVYGTEYPGKRLPEIAQLEWWHLLGGFFSAPLQDLQRAAGYIANQSESSNFIMIAPFLLLPSAYIIYKSFKQKSERRFTLLFLNILFVVLALRFVTELTGDGVLSSLARIVPNTRILLGIGFVAFLQLVVLAKDQATQTYPKWFVRTSTLLVGFVIFEIGFYIAHFYPGFLTADKTLLILIAAATLLYYLFIKKRLMLFAFLLLVISLYCSAGINPLYRGLDPLIRSPLSAKIQELDAQASGTWMSLDTLEFSTYLSANGVRSISGLYTYPQLTLWQKLDTDGRYHAAYNRYGQAVFSEYAPDKIYLVQNDMFHIKFQGCDPFIQNEVDYILSVHPTDTTCLQLIDTVVFPNKVFYIYKTNGSAL